MVKQTMMATEWVLLAVVLIGLFSCAKKPAYQEIIMNGHFEEARRLIRQELAVPEKLSPEYLKQLQFELERMDRIEKDFTLTETGVIDYVKRYLPEVTAEDLHHWEEELLLEYKIIDGEKRYFNNAHYNLFRLDPKLKQLKKRLDAERGDAATEKEFPLDEHIAAVMEDAKATGHRQVKPVRIRVKQSVIVKENVVPEGKQIRCWIPFPREIENRQTDIQLLTTSPRKYILADNRRLQRTIYFQQPSKGEKETGFSVEYIYTAHGVYVPVDPEKVVPVDKTGNLGDFLSERPPHIVFSKDLQELSRAIVGDEKNPYRIAQKLFAWVDTNITWASAREYSTFYNIPEYVIRTRHGDCGMQTLTFMTLCRLNGIPTKWQSGWEFQPPDDSMHDWGEIYFEPYGWVPMDVTYGLRDTDDEPLKWFYLSGMDSYRLIFNDDYSRSFEPSKRHFRSETIDSQRGEVEWDGGNLYFDQWRWKFEWEILE